MVVSCASANHPLMTADPDGFFELHGEVTPEKGRNLIAALRKAEARKAENFILMINSTGGDFNTGVAVNSLLRLSKIPTRCYVLKDALSSAFIILQGCSKRIAFDDAKLMIHRPFFYPASEQQCKESVIDRKKAAKYVDILTKGQATVVQILSERIGMSPNDINLRLEAGDWWMTPTGALSLGAIDEIFESQ